MTGHGEIFPEGSVTQELNRDKPDQFPVDPVSSEVASNKEEEAKMRSVAAAEEAKKCDLGNTLMSVLMISGVVVAAVGVAFFVTKKLKET
ncbi:hypothetical protein Cni_G27600 [Canna indica]|uniref:Uncharacterized protein n=1 Tax=Canna indica TaxID=4628 RepID=A0AAQ3L583_9LILI|nr:hypothetical protein Cni_G27600 [Canna indica]